MNIHKNYLDDDDVLTIRPQFAAFLGLNESVVVQQLHYWLKKAEKGQCGRFIEGHYWVWNNIPDWLEQFPFFSDSTLKRIFSNLKKDGIIHIKQFNGSNRTNFYRIDYKELDKFLENAQKSHIAEIPSEISPDIINTPLTPKRGTEVGNKKPKNKKTPTPADVAKAHDMTIFMIEDYVDYRLHSGGIEYPNAFKTSTLRKLSDLDSDESVQLKEWFEAFETQKNVIDYLQNAFLSTQRFDRRFCRELAKDDVILKTHNIDPSDVVIEIAYQKTEAKRRERIGGVA